MEIDIPTETESGRGQSYGVPQTFGGQQGGFNPFPTPTFGQHYVQPQPFGQPFSNAPNYFQNQGPIPQPHAPAPSPLYPQFVQQAPPQAEAFYPPVDLNSPMAQIGIQGAKSLIGNMQVQTFARRWFSSLKGYFAVNTPYVFSKLRIITFPFMHKSWTRKLSPTDMAFLPPVNDINAPDLYIPLLAFVTYILLVGFFMGAHFRFTPDILGITASSGLLALLVEVLILKALLFVFNLTQISFLDLIAYCGYKFVTATMIVISGLIFGSIGYYFFFVFNCFLLAIFYVKTFRAVIPKQEGVSSVLRTNFLLVVAGLQFLVVFFLTFFDFRSAGVLAFQ